MSIKNTCKGMNSQELRAALGVSPTSYYRYIEAPGYPLHADLLTQKAWIDEKQNKSTTPKATGKGKGDQDEEKDKGPVYGTKEYYELERIKYQAHNERMKLQGEIDKVLEAGQTIMRRKIGAMMEGMTDIIHHGLCGACSEKLVEEWIEVKAKLEAELANPEAPE